MLYEELLEDVQIIKENHIEKFICCCEAAGEGRVAKAQPHMAAAGIRDRSNHFLIVMDRGEINGIINNDEVHFKAPVIINIDSGANLVELNYSRSFHAYFVGIEFQLLLDIFRNRNPFPSPFRVRFRISEGFHDIEGAKMKIMLQDCRNLLGALGNKTHRFVEELNYAQMYILLTDFADIVWSKVQGEGPSHAVRQSRSEAIMLEFLECLAKNIEKDTSVEFFAGALCISKQYLSAVVRKQSGMAISKLISTFRYEHAMRLVMDPDYSIKEIADRCGFPDQATFGKFFRRHNGMSPAKYRRQLKNSLLTKRQAPVSEQRP